MYAIFGHSPDHICLEYHCTNFVMSDRPSGLDLPAGHCDFHHQFVWYLHLSFEPKTKKASIDDQQHIGRVDIIQHSGITKQFSLYLRSSVRIKSLPVIIFPSFHMIYHHLAAYTIFEPSTDRIRTCLEYHCTNFNLSWATGTWVWELPWWWFPPQVCLFGSYVQIHSHVSWGRERKPPA